MLYHNIHIKYIYIIILIMLKRRSVLIPLLSDYQESVVYFIDWKISTFRRDTCIRIKHVTYYTNS